MFKKMMTYPTLRFWEKLSLGHHFFCEFRDCSITCFERNFNFCGANSRSSLKRWNYWEKLTFQTKLTSTRLSVEILHCYLTQILLMAFSMQSYFKQMQIPDEATKANTKIHFYLGEKKEWFGLISLTKNNLKIFVDCSTNRFSVHSELNRFFSNDKVSHIDDLTYVFR